MPTWVGDAVMATPTLRSLRAGFPNAQLIGVMRPVIGDLLAGTTLLDECVPFKKQQRLKLIGSLRAAKLDVMVLLTNSLWTAAVARLAGIKRVVGYNRDARGWLLTDRVPVPSVLKSKQSNSRQNNELHTIPAIDYYLGLAEHMGCEVDDRRSELAITVPESELAKALWRQCGFDPNAATIVLNSNSATDISRLWPADKVRDLATQLATQHGYQVLLHCGPAEREMANRLAAEVNHPSVASMGQASDLPIGLTKAVLARAAAVVSTDSGPRHIAVALNRPVIGMFGPTDPQGTRTYNLTETILSVDLACRPCYAKTCPLKHGQCMQDISVQTVVHAIHRLRLPSTRAA